MLTADQYLREHRGRTLEDLIALLSFPTISADSVYAADMKAAADWIVDRLTRAGFENVRENPPSTHPIIYAERFYSPDATTILIYGHYDVQPAVPLDLWTTPPFEPEIRDGRIYARGATDMKGNLLLPVVALEAMIAAGTPPKVNIKLLLEGQEEIGSPELQSFVAANKDLLACDMIVSADSMQWREDIPAIWLGVRGMAAMQVDLYGPGHDLHSGLYGGAVQNPIHALVELLATLHDKDGHILVDGFYDDVVALTQAERDAIAEVPFDGDAYKAEINIPDVFGEPEFSVNERLWTRPTVEINGIWGGYQGEGPKTVIASHAHAKITCRLVANQEPSQALALVRKHLETYAPVGVRVEVVPHRAAARAYSVSAKTPGNIAAAEVLESIYGRKPLNARSGGSVPIYDDFKTALGVDTVMFGFSLDDELLHSPNEFTRIASFERGQIAYVRLFERLGEMS